LPSKQKNTNPDLLLNTTSLHLSFEREVKLENAQKDFVPEVATNIKMRYTYEYFASWKHIMDSSSGHLMVAVQKAPGFHFQTRYRKCNDITGL
jgi:hypothetical protein